MREILLVFASLLTCNCAHKLPPRSGVYVHPEQYVGQLVRVCGYIVDSSNIVESADSEDHVRGGGLSIAEKGPLKPLHRGWICEGEIVNIGCATGPRICLEAIYDYAIKIRSVVSPEKAKL